MKELIYTETINWKGSLHYLELFATDTEPPYKISQCQAVPFDKDGNIVLFKHINGYNSLPGGTVEPGESHFEALKREVYEESASTIINCGLIGYIKDTNQGTGKVKYQLRYWANVELLDEAVNDPDGKALERVLVTPKNMVGALGWGQKGQVLLELAQAARR